MQCVAADGGAGLNRVNSVGTPEMGIVLPEPLGLTSKGPSRPIIQAYCVQSRCEAEQETLEGRECLGSGRHEASGGARKACGPDAR
jgi:hypothetical protein